jgi:type IV secretion system protein VirB11
MLMQAGELPLRSFLEPVPELNDPTVREIVINRPGEIGIERSTGDRAREGGWTWREVPQFTLDRLDQIGILAGWALSKDLDAGNPICMTTLPDGQRCTIVRSPAVSRDTMSITIRNPSHDKRTVFDPDFDALMRAATTGTKGRGKADETLLALYRAKAWPEFFSLAVKSHKTIAATGTTGSGKTTFLKRLMREIEAFERLITIEDTDEFGTLPQRNRVSMFFGSANVTAEKAVEASLRMRPDRVAMQELRGAEAWAYIRLLAAGHPGGLTTWHAEDGDAFTPLALMAKQSEAGRNIPDDKLMTILRSFIDIVAYCKRDESGFSVPSVWFRAAEEEGAQ